QLRPAAESLSDPERAFDEIVQTHAARRHVPPQLPGSDDRELVDDLALDESQVAADAAVTPIARVVGVPVATQAGACDGFGFDGAGHRGARRRREVNVIDQDA